MIFFRRPAVLYTLLGLLFFGDRLLKFLAENFSGGGINFPNQFLRFGFYPNPYLFFIIELPPLLVFGATLVALLLLFIYYQEQKNAAPMPFYFISAGALSNFFDRAVHGYVIDFFLIFNSLTFDFADVLILLGLLMILVPVLKKRNDEP